MSYVFAGYGITFVALGGYALRVIRRGRALARALPPEPSPPAWP
jgi:CcmD family protein